MKDAQYAGHQYITIDGGKYMQKSSIEQQQPWIPIYSRDPLGADGTLSMLTCRYTRNIKPPELSLINQWHQTGKRGYCRHHPLEDKIAAPRSWRVVRNDVNHHPYLPIFQYPQQ